MTTTLVIILIILGIFILCFKIYKFFNVDSIKKVKSKEKVNVMHFDNEHGCVGSITSFNIEDGCVGSITSLNNGSITSLNNGSRKPIKDYEPIEEYEPPVYLNPFFIIPGKRKKK